MKKSLALALALVAIAAFASDAQAFGRRCGGRVFHRGSSCQSCQPAAAVASSTPTQNGVTYFKQYAPANSTPATTTIVVPATDSNCANGTCGTNGNTRGFGFFRRR